MNNNIVTHPLNIISNYTENNDQNKIFKNGNNNNNIEGLSQDEIKSEIKSEINIPDDKIIVR